MWSRYAEVRIFSWCVSDSKQIVFGSVLVNDNAAKQLILTNVMNMYLPNYGHVTVNKAFPGEKNTWNTSGEAKPTGGNRLQKAVALGSSTTTSTTTFILQVGNMKR